MRVMSDETRSNERFGRGVSELTKLELMSDDPEESIGAPVGLQIVGLRLEEEKVIKLTEVVVNALKAS